MVCCYRFGLGRWPRPPCMLHPSAPSSSLGVSWGADSSTIDLGGALASHP